MKKIIIFTILIVSLALTGCVKQVVKDIPDEADNTQAIEQGDNTNNDEIVSDNNEITAVKGNDKIKIFNIEDNQEVYSPLTITGEGIAFESTLQVELRDKDHKTMVHEFVMTKAPDVGEIGPFSITLNFEFNNTKEGYIAVYEQSAKDGSESNLVEIPVKFGN